MKHFDNSIAISLVIFSMSLLIFSSAYSSEDSFAVELLKKSYTNQRLVSHTGMLKTVAFLSEGTSDKADMSIVEIRQKDGKIRMDYKSGIFSGLSIIDDGIKIIRLDSKNRTVTISAIPFSNGDISLLLSNYEVIAKGTEKVANRTTQVLQIKPHNTQNPSRKLWIDQKTFMPLRSEHYNSDGMLIMLTFYTQIKYNAKTEDSDFSLPKDWRIVEIEQSMQKLKKEQISKTVGFDMIEPKYVPAGYVLDGFYLFYPIRNRKGNMSSFREDVKGLHIRYVDGLNTISIFEHLPLRLGRGMGRMRGMRHGWQDNSKCEFLDNRQGKVIRMTKGNLNITLVADIVEKELQKIASSF